MSNTPIHKWSSVDDLVSKEAEHDRFRRIAFIAIAFSSIVLFGSIIAMPMIYGYLQTLQGQINTEIGYCRFKSQSLWSEVYAIRGIGGAKRLQRQTSEQETTKSRPKRMWMFGKWTRESGQDDHVSGYDSSPPSTQYKPNPTAPYGGVKSAYETRNLYEPQPPAFGYENPTAAVQEFQPTCSCQTGPIGLTGDDGDDGEDGLDGIPGLNGNSGRDGQILPSSVPLSEPCTICPPAQMGSPGEIGDKGPRGLPGNSGMNGLDGKRGERGLIGIEGPTGRPGATGPKGSTGENGRIVRLDGPLGKPGVKGLLGTYGPKGQRGSDGRPGEKGASGLKGDVGKPGRNASPGVKGIRGEVGSPGLDGDCSHCPLPRLPPGY